MKSDMAVARSTLSRLLDREELTSGLVVRIHGKALIVARPEPIGPNGELENDDRVRLTRIDRNRFGLSVKRHTGRWERTPFDGSLEEMVGVIAGCMQHLVAKWP